MRSYKSRRFIVILIIVAIPLGYIIYNQLGDRYPELEEALEVANDIQIRQIWDSHHLGELSLDKSKKILECEYYETDDKRYLMLHSLEDGEKATGMWLVANFMYGYKDSLTDTHIGGEDNPPMYRAIKRVLDEIVKARMELRFKIINVNTEEIGYIQINSEDVKTAMQNWKEFH